jgi:hypothetical protein
MRQFILTVLLTSVAAPALAQTPSQFDLICTGKTEGRRENGEVFRTLDINTRYRIDLDRRVWCGTECDNVLEIVAVTPTRIQLLNQSPVGLQVDRTSGKLESLSIIGPVTVMTEGQCTRAHFSGIPGQAF